MEEFDELEPDIDEFDDKRAAAIHEAGHVVVAAIREGRFYGAYIKPTNTDTPLSNKLWGGQMYGINWARGGISSATALCELIRDGRTEAVTDLAWQGSRFVQCCREIRDGKEGGDE